MNKCSKLDQFEKRFEVDDLDEHDIHQWQEYQTSLQKIFFGEETYWQQRARLRWFLESDMNTKFFHFIGLHYEKEENQSFFNY